MAEKTHDPQSRHSANRPNVVIFVSDGTLLTGFPDSIANRVSIHVPISGPEMPLPAMTATIATGVHPMTHGIVTNAELNETTLEFRPVEATDRLFPAFWSQGCQTACIGWPGTANDPDLLFHLLQAEVNQRLEASEEMKQLTLQKLTGAGVVDALKPKTVLRLQQQLASMCYANEYLRTSELADVIGIAFKSPDAQDLPEAVTALMHQEIESFIEKLPSETRVVIIQRRTFELGTPADAVCKYAATYLIPDATHATTGAVEFPAVGGSIYTLTGVPCPHGATQPRWSFLPTCPESTPSRTFPLAVTRDERDWDQIIQRLLAKMDEDGQRVRRSINLLVKRWIILSNQAFWYSRWDRLEEFSHHLIALRGVPRDYWLKILSLQRQDKPEELKVFVEKLNEVYPDIPVTILSNCLVLIEKDPEQVASLLQEISPSDIRITSSLGVYGVLSIRVDLIEQGVEALETAIRKGLDSPSERAVLASYYYSQHEFVKSMGVLGTVGHVRGKMSWRLLRLQILVALENSEAAEQLATSILNQDPSNKDVQSILKGDQQG